MEEEVCCICLDSLGQGKIFLSGCSHPIHFQCAGGLVSKKCPMCRNKLSVPKKLGMKIKDNKKQHREEEEENERLALISSSQKVLLSAIPFFGVMAAEAYLVDLKINKRIKDIKIESDRDIDLFSVVVLGSIEKQRKKLVSKDLKKLSVK